MLKIVTFIGVLILKFLKFCLKTIKRLFEKLIRIFTTKFGVPFSIIMGVAFVVGSIYVSMQPIIDNVIGRNTIFKFAPNFICWSGGIIGTVLIMIPIMRWYYKNLNTIENLQKSIEELKKQLDNEKSKGGTDDFQYIFQLGVLELRQPINVPRKSPIINRDEPKGVLRPAASIEEKYESIMLGSRKVRLGLDFGNVFVAEDRNKIIIFGVKCIYVGISDLEFHWQIRQLTSQRTVNKKVGDLVIVRSHDQIPNEMERDIDNIIQNKINNEYLIDRNLASRIEKVGQEYIKILMGSKAKGKIIEFQEKPGGNIKKTKLLEYVVEL